jgi:excisionase family DNA binding protein
MSRARERGSADAGVDPGLPFGEPHETGDPTLAERSSLPAWILGRRPALDRPTSADEAPAEPSEYFTVEEFAAVFRGRTPRTVRRWIAAGSIAYIRIGRSVLIPRSELTRLTRRHMSLKG